MKTFTFQAISFLIVVLIWLPTAAIAQSSKESAMAHLLSSEECVIQKVKFTQTESSFRRSVGEFCGDLSGVCCSQSMNLKAGQSDVLTNNRKGTLAEPREPVASIMCRPNVHNFGVTDITWAVLQDVYGLDAIKNNAIPSGCLFTNPSTPQKDPVQPKTDPTHEQRVVLDALDDAHGDTAVAAKKLGISEKALVRKIKEYHVVNPEHR